MWNSWLPKVGGIRYSMVKNQNGRVKHLPGETYFRPGWKATITAGAWVLSICLTANVTLMIWAYVHDSGRETNSFENGLSVFEGDCDRANDIITWSHLAINIVSTLILSAGTACMQCLSSPTREEVDASHREGRWFHIGLLSSRNLLGIGRIRLVLYLVLAVSSVPLHFFYNSVLYSTLGVNDSLTIVTTEKFVSEDILNSTRLNALVDARKAIYPEWDYGNNTGYNIWTTLELTAPPYPSQDRFADAVNGLKPGAANTAFRNVSWDQCISQFKSTPYKKVQNVAIVTSVSDSQDDILDLVLTLAPGMVNWACNPANGTFNATNEFLGRCAQELNGTMPALQGVGLPTQQEWNVKYCLITDSPGHCSITFSPSLMIPVLVVNAIKLSVLLYTIFFLDYRPLITAGDAIVSFMERPDPVTEGIGAHSTQSVSASSKVEYLLTHLPDKWGRRKKEGFSLSRNRSGESGHSKRHTKKLGLLIEKHEKLMHKHTWRQGRKLWASAVSKARWLTTILPWTALTFAAIAYGLTARPNVNVGTTDKTASGEAWSQPLGAVNPGFIIRDLANNNLVTLVVISNLPQLALSCLWVLYIALMTSMLIASEMSDFAKETKGMRVSPPRVGAQRCTYFLQIPYRYSVPMTAAVIALHWLISQSLFLVRLSQFDIVGSLAYKTLESSLGYSLRGITASAACAGVMTLAPVFLSLRRFPKGIPILGYNSLALSIACHPSSDEPADAHALPLRYGLIEGSEEDGTKRPRLGFSAKPVKPIEEGVEYEATRCLSTVFAPGTDPDVLCSLEAPAKEKLPRGNPLNS